MPVIQRLSRQAQPKNRDSVRIARSSLDNLMPVIQEQYDNSLSVNALPVLFYHRKNSGIRCTCSIADNTASTLPNALPTEAGTVTLRPDGSGTEMYVQSVLQGAAISIDRYGSRNKEDFKNPQRSLPHSPLIQSDNVINKPGLLNDPFGDEIEPFDTDDLFNANGLAILNDNMQSSNADQGCGVCLGSNWVGGYDLLNGWRKILDGQVDFRGEGITIDIAQHPVAFTLDSASSLPFVQFEITLPVGAIGVDCIRLWNNKTQVNDNLQFQIFVKGKWLVLTEQVLLDNCDGLLHTIRIVFPVKGAVEQFTHLEIQLNLGSKPLLVDWPKQVESQDLRQAENLDAVQVNISPYVPTVRMFDVIAEMTYERLWLITNVTNGGDREKNVMGWEAGARMVQRLEFAWMLFVRRNPHIGDRFSQPHQKTATQGKFNPNRPVKAAKDR